MKTKRPGSADPGRFFVFVGSCHLSIRGSHHEGTKSTKIEKGRGSFPKHRGLAHAISQDVRSGHSCPPLTRRKRRFAIRASLSFRRRSIGMGNAPHPLNSLKNFLGESRQNSGCLDLFFSYGHMNVSSRFKSTLPTTVQAARSAVARAVSPS